MIDIRLAQNDDGATIERLSKAGGFNVDDLDWSDIYPHWLVAENGKGIIGCIQVSLGKPIGRLEMLGIDPELTHRERAMTAKHLVSSGSATLKKGGAQVSMSVVSFGLKSFKKVMKKRGAIVACQGNVMIRRL